MAAPAIETSGVAPSGVVLPARRRRRLPFSPWHLVLIPATIILIFPFAWLLITSLETPAEALHFPPILIPHHLDFGNYPQALQAAPFGRFFINSAVVAVLTVIGNLVLCSAGGLRLCPVSVLRPRPAVRADHGDADGPVPGHDDPAVPHHQVARHQPAVARSASTTSAR